MNTTHVSNYPHCCLIGFIASRAILRFAPQSQLPILAFPSKRILHRPLVEIRHAVANLGVHRNAMPNRLGEQMREGGLEGVGVGYHGIGLAVSPAPLETGSFSPRPTDRLTCFFAMVFWCKKLWELHPRKEVKASFSTLSCTHPCSVL